MITAIFRPARHKPAIIVAGVYWCSVAAAYAYGAIVDDGFGLAYILFMCLALPWSLLVYSLPKLILWAVFSLLLSGVNALVLYYLIAGISALLAKALGRSSE